MEKPISTVQRFIWWIACTDEQAILLCSPLTQFYQTNTGVAVMLTGVFALLSGGYAIFLVVRNAVFTAPIAALYALAVINIDRFIVSGRGRRLAWIRFLLAVVIGYVVAVPLELRLFEDRINQQLELQERGNNHDAEQRRMQGQDELKARVNELEHSADSYRTQINHWGEIMEAEVVGRVRADATGKSGLGPAYREAEQQKQLNAELFRQVSGELEQARRAQNAALKQIDSEYQRQHVSDARDLVARKEALDAIEAQHPDVAVMSWAIKLLLMLFEICPALMKLMSPYTAYAALVEAREREDIQRRHSMANHNLREMVFNPNDETLFIMRQTVNVHRRAGVLENEREAQNK